MLSRAVGHMYGVSKKASPIIVRLPPNKKYHDTLEGLGKVLADVKRSKTGDGSQLSVLSLSLATTRLRPKSGNLMFPKPDGSDGYMDVLQETQSLLKKLAAEGVLTVIASGNEGEVSHCLSQLLETREVLH